MKKFSKVLCVILSLIIALFAAGCGRNDKNNSKLESTFSEIQSEIEKSESISSSSESSSQPAESSTSESGSSSESISESSSEESSEIPPEKPAIDENGSYSSKEDVALYIHTYGKLPKNFMTKKEAQKLGWSGGSLEKYAPGMCIGGDYFGNYDGLLPKKSGRKYTECDIDTLGQKTRGAKRIVFSNDGLIYYTDDHYESFTLLYGEE